MRWRTFISHSRTHRHTEWAVVNLVVVCLVSHSDRCSNTADTSPRSFNAPVITTVPWTGSATATQCSLTFKQFFSSDVRLSAYTSPWLLCPQPPQKLLSRVLIEVKLPTERMQCLSRRLCLRRVCLLVYLSLWNFRWKPLIRSSWKFYQTCIFGQERYD